MIFICFASRVRVWIDKIEAQWEAQEEARRLREQEEASRAKGWSKPWLTTRASL